MTEEALILKTLKPVSYTRTGQNKSPIIHRRKVFVQALKKQIDGITNGTKHDKWYWNEKGKTYFVVRYARKPVNIDGHICFEAKDEKHVLQVFQTLVEQTNEGLLDDVLTQHYNTTGYAKK